jgi:dolichol-phosphate mannosyltransferase
MQTQARTAQPELPLSSPQLAVVIPCYKVKDHILDVIARIGPEVAIIFAIDDGCPDGSGKFIEANARDPRLRVLYNLKNKGVGGAVMTGYRAALDAGADVVVKVDGDGQMDPALIAEIARPVLMGRADYAKGNRFHSVWNVRQMPAIRLFGNAALSFLTKLSSGYWSIFDPTNGYTAIHAEALRQLEFANINERYFFESDMLINLGNARAVVQDVPMRAVYGGETSHLKIRQIIGQFLTTNVKELMKRILYTYFLRDFSLASAQLLSGVLLFSFGTIFGLWGWYGSISSGNPASTGTIMVAVLPVILGFQLLLSFFGFDMANEPKVTLQPGVPARDWMPALPRNQNQL